MNHVIIIGRLTKQPELRFTSGSGIAVTTFTVAVDRNFKNAEGNYEADFINCRAWRKLAELVANNLDKGRLVCVHGSIQTGKYTAQDGSTRYTTEVVASEVKFLDRAKDSQGDANYNQADVDAGFESVEGDEDIPF